jgi:hypothetical protein
MKAVSKILLSGAALAALASAAPAAAQYPGYGYGYGYGYQNNNVVGSILNSILGGRSYGQNDRYAIDMCVRATEARLNGYQGAYGYGYGTYGGYGNNGYNNGYNGARVVSITNLERRSNGGLKVYGLATAGYNSRYGYGGGYNNGYNNGYGGYNNGYGYNGYGGAQLRFNCKINYRGQVTDVDIDRRRY